MYILPLGFIILYIISLYILYILYILYLLYLYIFILYTCEQYSILYSYIILRTSVSGHSSQSVAMWYTLYSRKGIRVLSGLYQKHIQGVYCNDWWKKNWRICRAYYSGNNMFNVYYVHNNNNNNNTPNNTHSTIIITSLCHSIKTF